MQNVEFARLIIPCVGCKLDKEGEPHFWISCAGTYIFLCDHNITTIIPQPQENLQSAAGK